MKEYRVREQITHGPYAGKWHTALLPNGSPCTSAFSTLDDAKNWIEEQCVRYEQWNRMLPQNYRKQIPPYKIEVREVTPWQDAE